ncbi:MAG: hypothetical protein LBU07_07620 [Coriobacteriales bacterium]|jgi:hypothetical protein|nr:hypothetical protein [Coriobacteriales bacterium]
MRNAHKNSHAKDTDDMALPVSEYVQLGKGHGRIERRTYYACNTIQSLDAKMRPEVKGAGMVIRERCPIRKDAQDEIVLGPATTECATYVLSRPMDACEFACHARGHWGIENSLH